MRLLYIYTPPRRKKKKYVKDEKKMDGNFSTKPRYVHGCDVFPHTKEEKKNNCMTAKNPNNRIFVIFVSMRKPTFVTDVFYI